MATMAANHMQFAFVAGPVDHHHASSQPDAGQRVGHRPALGDCVRDQFGGSARCSEPS